MRTDRSLKRLRSLALIGFASVLVSACGGGTGNAISGPAPEMVVEGPLGPRNDAVLGAVGDEAIVFGGNDFFCPPTADCAAPETAPFSDGAAYDVLSGGWRSIADAPFGVDNAKSVAHDETLYTIVQCEKAANCPVGRSMLSYDVPTDTWEQLAAVPGNGSHQLVFVGDDLYAISSSDETGQPDYSYNAAADTWLAVAPPPMPPVFDRFGVEFDGALILYGSPIEGPSRDKLAASYDTTTSEWKPLSTAPSAGFQPFAVGDVVILNGHFGDADGASNNPTADIWAELPFPPDASSWTGNIAGVMAEGEAQYESSSGWFLDIRSDLWIELRSAEMTALNNEAVVAVGERLFTFGGHYYTDDEVRIDGGAWVWTPRQTR